MTALVLILFLFWLAGMIGGATFGGLIHLVLVVAVIVFILDLLGRRRPL